MAPKAKAEKSLPATDEIQLASNAEQVTSRGKRARRRRGEIATVSIQDVQDFVDEYDVFVVYIKTAQKACKKIWDRIPDARKVMDEAEKAMEHYDAVADKYLAGTAADNKANRETAPAVTAAALQAVKDAAKPLAERTEALKNVLDSERGRLEVVVKGRCEAWQRGFDDCLMYALVSLFVFSLVWWFIGYVQHVSEEEQGGLAPPLQRASGEAVPSDFRPTATITDEL